MQALLRRYTAIKALVFSVCIMQNCTTDITCILGVDCRQERIALLKQHTPLLSRVLLPKECAAKDSLKSEKAQLYVKDTGAEQQQ